MFRFVEFAFASAGVRAGFCQIRHRASHAAHVPAECASHIYYEIEARYRGQGYGKRQLALALEKAKMFDLSESVICASEENFASRRVIEVNGGLLTGCFLIGDGSTIRRYLIRLTD